FALTVWNNALYVGGTFDTAGSTSARRVARWNGATWADVGGGTSSTVFSLEATEESSAVGPALYVGGNFNNTGETLNVNGIAKWDGSTWSRLSTGMIAIDGSIGTVNALLIHA